MATPFNPFSGRGQRGAANPTSTASRGHGTPAGRGGQFPPRGSSAARGKYNVNRGRGLSQSRGRGRGRGAGASSPASSHSGSGTQSPQLQPTSSPFNQLSQQKPASNPFGAPNTQQKSPFAGIQSAPISHTATQAPQFIQKPIAANPAGGGLGNVPVENATILSQYHERYDQLKVDRAKQRQRAIKDGQMADPNQPTSLNNAITPVGTCASMCPEFERVERIVQKMVDKSEKYLHPSTSTLQNMETKMLKRFRRSAAGYDEQLPSDIRTPNALLQSTNYLIRHIVGGNEPLGIIHKFVWDRTRSIRNDFSVQQVTQERDVKIAVTCLERIARFHIVSLHLLSSPENEEPFDRHQEREQLNNTMLSLMYYYDDHRGRIHFPNEDEFRAYYIIFSIHDQRPDLEARVSKWPTSLLTSPRVQVALELYAAACNTWEYQGTLDARRPNAIAQGFYTRFFNIINSPCVSYLMACIAEIYFSYVRQTAIRAIWKGYCKTPMSQQHKNQEWTVEDLTRVLHFDDDEETIKFLEEQDLQTAENANGELYLDWGNRPVDSIGFSPSSEHAYSEITVESKRGGRSLVAVILGMNIREAATMGLLDESKLHEHAKPSSQGGTGEMSNSPLFVSEDENTFSAPLVEPAFSTLESDRLTESSASSTPNPFQTTLPDTSQPSGLQPAIAPPKPSNPFKASPLNPFASPFPSSTATNNAPATSSTAFNPFAAAVKPTTSTSIAPAPSPPPFSFGKPAEEEKSVTKSTPAQSPSPFATSGLFKPTSEPSTSALNPFAASLSSLKASQSSNSTPQQPTSLFPTASPGFPSTALKDASAAEVSTSQPASMFSASNPSFPSAGTGGVSTTDAPTPKPASPFNFASPTQSSQSPFTLPSSDSVSQSQKSSLPPTSAIDPAEKPRSPFNGANGFHNLGQSFSKVSSSEQPFSEQKQSQGVLPKAAPPAQSTGKPLSASSILATEPFPSSRPSNPLFSAVKPTEQAEQKLQEAPANAKPPFTQSTNLQSMFPPKTSINDTPIGNSYQPQKPALPAATTKTNSTESDKSVASLNSSLSSQDSPNPSIKRKFEDGPPVYATKEEEQNAWHGLLQRLSAKQARKRARKLELEQQQEREAEQEERRKAQEEKRKRALEEAAADELPDGRESKALKVSDLLDNSAPSKEYSLFQASTRTLPTLPCLETSKESTERKGPTDAEIEAAGRARRQREIDQDELLLSAARIAAEQLKNGPKIFDPHPSENTQDRHSYNLHRSFSASTPYSQSMSPPPPPVYPNHGYNVAYAPDTPLGLGRTMSRTEQRIRRTGAHGLAYLPLDFSRAHSKSLDDKNKFSRSG
ncbi:uncharacterized protein N7503_011163 [Penicillium pulvis]|uniref:uncharacterized protein n=1 Tax=Penicillium pulvis TaxID=1562058 RepID=UPI002546BFC4|nr:uncharacterized protein N7503_011163 [Penicillium pulvis]KAJ5785951.1 hypothetical protein N7503_011163 [Penicillium pulvis]